MFTDRSAAILRRLEEKGEVKVSELSSLLGCSEVTIRNDIRKLEKKGALRRTHGGAVAKEGAGRRAERLQGSWLGKNVEKKQAIAREAYRLIGPDGSPYNRYLLCYDSRIIEIWFDWEPTPAQMAVTGEKLS